MFKFTVILAGIGLIAAGSACAGQRAIVGWSGNGSTVSIVDKATIKRTSETSLTAWLTLVYNGSDLKGKNKYDKMLYRFDCSNQTLMLLSYVSYDSSGTVITSQKLDYPESSYIVPDSIGEAEAEYLCMSEEERLETPDEKKEWFDMADGIDPVTGADRLYEILSAKPKKYPKAF
jgi:hypothetical protein